MAMLSGTAGAAPFQARRLQVPPPFQPTHSPVIFPAFPAALLIPRALQLGAWPVKSDRSPVAVCVRLSLFVFACGLKVLLQLVIAHLRVNIECCFRTLLGVGQDSHNRWAYSV